jgi:hypothetical protein
VNRLGKFSPKGGLFAFGSYMKITEVADSLGHYIQLLRSRISFDKNGSCNILGEFFTNSSNHPALSTCQVREINVMKN